MWNNKKLGIALLLLVLGSGCTPHFDEATFQRDLTALGKMGEAYHTFTQNCDGDCHWSRTGLDTLVLNGEITEYSYDEFAKKIDGRVREIKLNSGGGYAVPAIKIAMEIKRRHLNVTVDGFCISSCANYLFLAGTKKRINGLLGFHGSLTAAIEKNCVIEKKPLCLSISTEQDFFRSVGVSNLLFDVTQSQNKGMRNSVTYMYYAPSATTLKALGITDIVGDQNQLYLQQMAHLYKKYKLIEFSVATDPNPEILARLNTS